MKLTLKHALAGLILILNLAAPVAAGPLEDGVAANDRGDYAVALNTLGVMYGNGKAVPRDYARAYMWFDLAARAGYQRALNNIDAVAQHTTPAQVAEAQKLAREWKPNMQRPQ